MIQNNTDGKYKQEKFGVLSHNQNHKFNGFRPQGSMWEKKFTFIINSNVPLEGNYYSIDIFIVVPYN